MTEKALGLLEALATFLLSILPLLMAAGRKEWQARRKVRYTRSRDPPDA